mmetsp:Transcript_46959/g.53038  ORF Transcript_46959/g.53038 Transcript_46959/m.53038 type:complete len:155 (-) Transcript_46959:3-467(-)
MLWSVPHGMDESDSGSLERDVGFMTDAMMYLYRLIVSFITCARSAVTKIFKPFSNDDDDDDDDDNLFSLSATQPVSNVVSPTPKPVTKKATMTTRKNTTTTQKDNITNGKSRNNDSTKDITSSSTKKNKKESSYCWFCRRSEEEYCCYETQKQY